MSSIKNLLFFSIISLACCATFKFPLLHSLSNSIHAGEALEENPEQRFEWERQLLSDPVTGNIPVGIRARELAFVSTLPNDRAAYKNGLNGNVWLNVGPWNIGGRTRIIMTDAIDENILYAGGVTGGIWKSIDNGNSWERKTTPDQMPAITCLWQNPKKPDILYAGTGEATGSSASDGGAYYLGNGLYKSVDHGETWSQVTRTASNSPNSFDRNWDLVWKVVTYPTDTGDVFFAATYGSIYKSNNGGKNILQVKGGTGPLGGNQAYYTDINVSAKGVLYATLSSEGYEAGIWRCADAVKWTKITPQNFPKQYQRIVSGISPSDENQVYFLVHTISEGKKSTNFRGDVEYNQLWKYTYTGDTSIASLGIWEDLSQNLPDKGGQFGGFFTQNSYDMCVAIKPNDPNTVIIGGTNLWRSTDGFKTSGQTAWIGGYGVNTSLPDFKMYPNHHPDNHWVQFYRNKPDQMLSACDGGIFRTDQIMASNVDWTPLNHGYLTTQFYTVAMDHAPGGNVVIGGLQDNGTQWTSEVNNLTFSWTMPFSGDGSHCYVPDSAKELFVSKQEGKIYKIKTDQNGSPTAYARLDPLGAIKKYQFINPFAVDPRQQKRLYIPDGDRIYRNNNVDLIQYKPTLDSIASSLGWDELTNTTDTLQVISAITVSASQPDVLYYGTSIGKLFRLRNASSGQPTPETITGTNFPAGNINCILTHPDDSNFLMVVFTNYNTRSIFYSRNGGTSWTDGSGNLEQFPDGSGNGPSCRWANVLPMKGFNAWFMATSAGLFTTDSLRGSQTKWVLQGTDNIGNYPCTMIDVRRSDGLVLVATHGAGVFAATFTERWQVLGIPGDVPIMKETAGLFPNPTHEKIYIPYVQPHETDVNFKIYNLSGTLVKEKQYTKQKPGNYTETFDVSDLSSGIYFLKMCSGVYEQVIKFQIIH